MLKTRIVLLRGLPASGKSSLSKQYLDNRYEILSRDITGGNSLDLLALLQAEIFKGHKIVIDNTNYSSETRKAFITLAKQNGVTIGLHTIDTTFEDCLINSLNRMYDKHEDIYMHINEVPAEIKKEANTFVISAIFSISKKMKKKITGEDYDEIELTKFCREDKYGYTNKAIFIDLDGTIRKSNGEQPYPLKKSDIEILPNTQVILEKWKQQGYKVFAVSNQSGVKKGLLTIFEVMCLIDHTNQLIGYTIDDFYFCQHLPPDVCYCRKPQSGMGILFMHKYQLDLKQCIMVGDQTSDQTFARRLGMNYWNANDFFER